VLLSSAWRVSGASVALGLRTRPSWRGEDSEGAGLVVGESVEGFGGGGGIVESD